MCLGLVGTMTSVAGNKAARRFDRVNYITFVMLVSVVFAAFIGFWGGNGYWLTAVLCLLYAGVIWADSSTLTAGTVGSAVPKFRGAKMAVHSMLGYLGGFYGAARFRHRAGCAGWYWADRLGIRVHISFSGCDARAGRIATIASAKSCRA